jgi:hypothetical protein
MRVSYGFATSAAAAAATDIRISCCKRSIPKNFANPVARRHNSLANDRLQRRRHKFTRCGTYACLYNIRRTILVVAGIAIEDRGPTS